ncbi:hypothetical protein J6590_053761 [Homalodisca vitripennis]|nr:hypothetical protein J6590_053761 [Homalodisca vitripennis]
MFLLFSYTNINAQTKHVPVALLDDAELHTRATGGSAHAGREESPPWLHCLTQILSGPHDRQIIGPLRW